MSEDTANAGGGRRLSERAMVPLALVGALVLLSSVLLVGHVHTSGEPEPDVDAAVALDRTEATMQTVLRDSTQRAAATAAAEPVTDPADSEWGDVLARSGAGFGEDPFVNYLRGLVYLEASDDLDLAGQEMGDVETNVTLPPVTDPAAFADGIRRVELDDDGSEVTVSLANVTITATRAGEVIERRETTVEVTVVTPVLQLHDRVSEYQYAIDEAGVTERGFTQRFNARTYAIGWARGWAQNYRAPVGEVLANRHVEPSANAALYRTQQDVFGDADPNLKNAVRLGWACMALKDGEAMFEEYAGERSGLSYETLRHAEDGAFTYNDSHAVDVPDGAGELCSDAHFLLDQAIEQHPRPPEVTELIGGRDLLRETETQSVGGTAHYPLVEMADPGSAYSFENAVQRIFTIEGYVDADVETAGSLQFDVDCGAGYRSGSVSREGSYEVTTTSREQVVDDDERYYVYESTVDVTVTAERTCHEREGNGTTTSQDTDSYTVSLTTTVGEEEDSPSARIDELNPSSEVSAAHKYDPGPDSWGPPQFNNYEGAGDQVTDAILGGTDSASHERWVRDRMAETDYEEEPPGPDAFETTAVVELDHEALLGEFKLTAEMLDAVVELREEAAGVSTEYERRELLTGNPTDQLLDELAAEIEAELDEPAGHRYESVGEKALYEAQYTYYLALVEQLEALEDAHAEATGALDDRIAAADDSLADATRFVTQGIRQQEADPDAFESSALTGDVSYEVSGSPTYLLSSTTVDTERVPPVDQDVEFAPLRATNENAFDLPYDEVVSDVLAAALDGLPKVSVTPDAELTLRAAGDVLAAGELAVDAHRNARATDRDDAYLDDSDEFERDLAAFEESVEHALEEFEHRVAERTVAGLYPARGKQGEPGAPVARARRAVESGVASALDPYGTAETARLVGEGAATEFIVDNVTDELGDPAYRSHAAFDDQYDERQWDDLVEGAVRPAVTRASATSVEVGSAERARHLDEQIQDALGEATETAVADRVDRAGEAIGETVGERWLGNPGGTKQRAARVPAGLPLVPLPGKWVATANAWTIDVAGEYARFEATATVGTPADGTQLTYVRENRTVGREVAGAERTLGSVEAIAFESRTVLVVATPPGVGVGDRDSENPECSVTYPHVGEVDPERDDDCSSLSTDD